VRLGIASVLLAGLGGTAACSGAPGEDAASTGAAVTQSEGGTFTNGQLALALSVTDFWGSTVSFANGAVTFHPSADGSLVNLSQVLPSVTVALPTVSTPSSTLVPSYTATITSFASNLSQGQLTLTPNGVQATVSFTATAHLSPGNSPYPSADLDITNATVTTTLGWNAAAQQFTVASVTANVQDHVSGCPLGNICNAVMQAFLPNLDSGLQRAVTSALTSELSSSSVAPKLASALGSVFAQSWNLAHENDEGGGPPWAVVPGTIQYSTTAGGEFSFEAQRVGPVSCTFTTGCQGSLFATCTPNAANQPVTVSMSQPGGYSSSSQTIPASGFVEFLGQANIPAYLTVCEDARCDDPVTLVPSAVACVGSSSGGGGGGGSGGGYHGPSGCVGACIQ
jgi:hypothetical protein